MLKQIELQLQKLLQDVGIENPEFSVPPNSEMGDVAMPCFEISKKEGKNPINIANELVENLKSQISNFKLIDSVEAFGPYVNFFLNSPMLATIVLDHTQDDSCGRHDIGAGKKVLIEFGCPNPLKVFHLGHLKNLITGESVVRVFENAGYDVVRVNYQGDVGMHVAKALWGIYDLKEEFDEIKTKSLDDKITFLGRAYAHGAKNFEENEDAKKEILVYNKKVYARDKSIQDVYMMTRAWSLEYFDIIYKKLDTHFDHLYFESEVFEKGLELVQKGLKKGIFKKSDDAIIYEGSTHDLHDRVFINSLENPTYEAKELGLAYKHFDEYHPDKVIHVVGKEQTGYFQVVFRAMAEIIPESKGKEYHLVGGYLQLKGNTKMSSRLGNVISGDELLAEVEGRVIDIMKESDIEHKHNVVEKVTAAILKYAMLKSNVSQDVAFDMQESINFSGDSGAYLLYIVARIKSILKKLGEPTYADMSVFDFDIQKEEKKLLMQLSKFDEVTFHAYESYDPSKVAKYLLDLAQMFNAFYAACSVLQSQNSQKAFRIKLIISVERVMERGLYLLGISTVDEM